MIELSKLIPSKKCTQNLQNPQNLFRKLVWHISYLTKMFLTKLALGLHQSLKIKNKLKDKPKLDQSYPTYNNLRINFNGRNKCF